MRALLSRPYRSNLHDGGVPERGLLFGGFVFLFLLVFEPFGLNTWPGALWPIALGYGLVCTVMMVVLATVVPRLFPGAFAEERWTVGREITWILFNVAVIGLANAIYSAQVGIGSFAPRNVLWLELYTLLIGIFPVIAVVLVTESQRSKRFKQGSREINAGMVSAADALPTASTSSSEGTTSKPEVSDGASNGMIVIPTANGQDLLLPSATVLFIRSAGNYAEVHQVVEGKTARQVIRASLKQIEEALRPHPQWMRCHKSHLVDIRKVERVSGNAQGYKLHLRGTDEPVPVSRQWNDRLAGLLADRP